MSRAQVPPHRPQNWVSCLAWLGWLPAVVSPWQWYHVHRSTLLICYSRQLDKRIEASQSFLKGLVRPLRFNFSPFASAWVILGIFAHGFPFAISWVILGPFLFCLSLRLCVGDLGLLAFFVPSLRRGCSWASPLVFFILFTSPIHASTTPTPQPCKAIKVLIRPFRFL